MIHMNGQNIMNRAWGTPGSKNGGLEPLLTDLPLDLHIHICEFLHPSQILALRQTCKAVYEATLQRTVWIHALDRICRENLLFLPALPTAAMSVVQLERAATPLRWFTAITALYIFEIYPQKESPELAKIATLMLNLLAQEYATYSMNGNTVVIYDHRSDKGTVIIPPRTTNSSLLNIQDPPELAPVLIFNVPSSVLQTPDSWYNDVPIYIDVLRVESHETGIYDRCKLDITSDLNNVSLVPIAAETIEYPIGYRIRWTTIGSVMKDS
ncbi:hypothetical protein BYT27DRAFT_7315038 [Phlegmacium glaucopus]|nr:hypothetical protein BYT27DRAFT_7315038 [Phlegmacium glaucopus]